jgi:hypothetical protein
VVQSIPLYGSETWHLNQKSLKPLQGFHQNIARLLTNKHPRRIHPTRQEWICTNANEALEEANLLTIDEYIQKRKVNLLHWAQKHPGLLWGPSTTDRQQQ